MLLFKEYFPAQAGVRQPMKYYLAKTEPGTYSISDLERDGTTVWDGVTNPQAVRSIREMKKGDRVLIYHSGGESAVVGMAEIRSDGRDDPKNPKSAVAEFQFLTNLDPPVTLREIKESGKFSDWVLVRQGRLSTMAVPDSFIDWIRGRYPSVKF
jgi:predicted RNA-binding protein with PUA-like domain